MMVFKLCQTLRVPAAVATVFMMQGCVVKPLMDDAVLKHVNGNVVVATVTWQDRFDRAQTPAFYNNEAKYFNWQPVANQYRWIQVTAYLRSGIFGNVFMRTLVADGVPALRTDDLVEVFVGDLEHNNYAELRAPVVLRLVCRSSDTACINRTKKEFGGVNEVVSIGRPASLDRVTFTRFYDLEGKPLKHLAE